MTDVVETPEPKDAVEPDIIIIGIDRGAFYLLKGDDYLDQMLLEDGLFPTPILCVHFESVFDAKQMLSHRFNVATSWAIHPEILKRLRDKKCLVETDA